LPSREKVIELPFPTSGSAVAGYSVRQPSVVMVVKRSKTPAVLTGAGTFADPTATATMFTCTRAGDVHVVVHVGLPGTSCDDSLTFLVHCQL
jgi:hypothetical protein